MTARPVTTTDLWKFTGLVLVLISIIGACSLRTIPLGAWWVAPPQEDETEGYRAQSASSMRMATTSSSVSIYTTRPFSQPLVVYHRGYRRNPDATSVGTTEPVFRRTMS